MLGSRSASLLVGAIMTSVLSLAPGASAAWGIVLDMGSSGTRARIHSWEQTVAMTEFVPEDSADKDALEISPGLADVRPADIDGYLRPLIAQVVRWIPAEAAPATRIRAFATAGMRTLDSPEQEAIWAAVREVLADRDTSPFLFDPSDATTISGNLEGLFGFLAVNFILEVASAANPAEQLVGAMDLGGASVELAFAPDGAAPIMADAYRTVINERAIQVYSHSYMNAGQDVARSRLAEQLVRMYGMRDGPVENPCLSVGYLDNRTIEGVSVQFIGVGDYERCLSLMPGLLHPDYECLQRPCAAMGVYQPTLPRGRHSLVAYSAFFYTVNGLGLLGWGEASGVGEVEDITPARIMDAGAAELPPLRFYLMVLSLTLCAWAVRRSALLRTAVV